MCLYLDSWYLVSSIWRMYLCILSVAALGRRTRTGPVHSGPNRKFILLDSTANKNWKEQKLYLCEGNFLHNPQRNKKATHTSPANFHPMIGRGISPYIHIYTKYYIKSGQEEHIHKLDKSASVKIWLSCWLNHLVGNVSGKLWNRNGVQSGLFLS